MNLFKQSRLQAERHRARRALGAIGMVAALLAPSVALVATMLAAPAAGQRLPPPVNVPPIIVVTPQPAPTPAPTPAPAPAPATTVDTGVTQTNAPTHPVTPLGWYLMGGIFCAAASPIIGTIVLNREMLPHEVWTSTLTCFLGPVGWIVAQQLFPPGSMIGPATQLMPTQPSGPDGTEHLVDRSRTSGPNRDGFSQPPRGALFVHNELVVSTESGVTNEALDALLRGLRITRLESLDSALIGRSYHRLRINSKASVPTTIRTMRRQTLIATAQPNFIVRTAQDNAAEPKGDPDQYAIGKLHLPEVHRLATGKGVLIAVIDSEIDAAHPDLAGAIAANFDSTGTADEPDPHGTGMAGAIASHSKLLGVAPRASLLAVRAFAKKSGGAEGTTFRIVKGLDWAAAQNARIVNMSFAGPSDPAVQAALEGAHDRGLVLVAAAGNAGPKSPPLYPASDPNVIAVTATDVDDELFTNANRGKHIAVAAPGVDVLVPAPGDSYQITSGTSVAAAEVSGVAALMLERNPALKPDEVRRILMATARHLGAKGRNPEFGAGLVDPREAVEMAPRGVAQTQ